MQEKHKPSETVAWADLAGMEWMQHGKMVRASQQLALMPFDFWNAWTHYHRDFAFSLAKAIQYFYDVEMTKAGNGEPMKAWAQYAQLINYNFERACEAALSSTDAVLDYHLPEFNHAILSALSLFTGRFEGDFFDYIERKAEIVAALAHQYPEQIQNIADEFGFHFESGGYVQVAETDRFVVYQVLPTESGVSVHEAGKPVLIVHPYVLGHDILAFLPGENKSYVHCFANHGIPTYVRILKDIEQHEAVQRLTLEDDIGDTRYFCEQIRQKHGRPLTLNGYCQGGLITLSNLLSGELDGLVDTHITCVAPIDGTRSKGFRSFLGQLPERFNRLEYGTKTLPNGNRVADGDLMAWVYKIKSIENEYPIVSFYRDLAMIGHMRKKKATISKTAAALNYWLNYQRHDLPLEITRMSFDSYNTPITDDGTLPFQAFGRPLNIRRLGEKGIRMLICYGEQDALVEPPCALAPQDYIDVEVTPFPKGHVAIATSWSLPTSDYALHTRFGDKGYRGPVRFHLDIEQGQG